MSATICYMGTHIALNIDAIGRRAADRRKSLGLEQGDIASRAGMSRAYVSRLENGSVKNPKVTDLSAIATAPYTSSSSVTPSAVAREQNADLTDLLTQRFGPELGPRLAKIERALAAWQDDDRVTLRVILDRLLLEMPTRR